MKDLSPTVGNDSAHFLSALGFSDDFLTQLDAGAMDDARERALAWVNGIVSNRGRDRGKSVRDCGRLFPALLPSGKVVILARPCKDRACPRCMVALATRRGAQLRTACDIKSRAGSTLCFVTLTQKKKQVRGEDARGAMARVMTSWARLTRSSSRQRNARLRSMFRGGVRGIECVWSGRGSEIFSARAKGQDLGEWKESRRVVRRVRYNGWHAHLHCVFELEQPEGYSLGEPLEEFEHELRHVWEWASKGADPVKGVDVQELQVRNVGQVAKYITKPFELPPDRARELFRAVHSRRMLDGFGCWKSWRKWAPEDPNPYAGAALGSVSLASLAWRHKQYESRGRGATRPEPVAFCRWTHCKDSETTHKDVVEVLQVSDLHARLRQQAGEANYAAVQRWADAADTDD
ncbi:MAG: protein rep [Nannocystaceae bacterium]